METDDNGHFVFDNVDLMDSTTVYFQAKTLKERKSRNEDLLTPNRNLFIVMDTLVPPEEPYKKTFEYSSTPFNHADANSDLPSPGPMAITFA